MNKLKIFDGSRVIVTGHTGFKGSWLVNWLDMLGAEVYGVGLDPLTNPSHFEVTHLNGMPHDNRFDIRDLERLRTLIDQVHPDFVFHLAGQSIVSQSFAAPVETFEVNTMGTVNILEALRLKRRKCVVVLITSDKCYENVGWTYGYREIDVLGGKDPYSASKAAAELVIKSYYESFIRNAGDCELRIGIARAGNVIGGGDWSSYRIVPDCIKSWNNGLKVELRKPHSTRPWQHVLEPLFGYLVLASNLYSSGQQNGEAFNFGPPMDHNYTVADIVDRMAERWGRVGWVKGTSSATSIMEAELLKLNCEKAKAVLDWSPIYDIKTTVEKTVDWYLDYKRGDLAMREVTRSQISDYMLMQLETKSNG